MADSRSTAVKVSITYLKCLILYENADSDMESRLTPWNRILDTVSPPKLV
jgi:hypothetical protein